MGWTLGAALAEGYRLGGMGQYSSNGGTWGTRQALWLLAAVAASGALVYLAATSWRQQRQRLNGSGRAGLGLGGGFGLASWLPLPLRSLVGRLPGKGSGAHLVELSIDSPPPSTDRSGSSLGSSLATSRTLSDLVPGGSPFPSSRTSGGSWAAPNGLAPGGTAAALPGGSAAGGRPRSLSWGVLGGAAGHEAPASGAGAGQDEAYASSRLGRSRTYSRRSLSNGPDVDPQ